MAAKASAQPAVQITPPVRAAILQQYQEAKPKPGNAYETWAETTAEAYNCSVQQVKNVVSQEAQAFLIQVRQQRVPEAQQIAQIQGATLAKAYGVLIDAMQAGKTKYFRDKQGKPVIDQETGKYIVIEEPLWNERLRAAELLCKIHGAFAAQQIEIEETVKHEVKISLDEAAEKVAELHQRIQQIRAGAVATGTDRIAGTSEPGTPGRKGSPGPILLADFLHEDKGRTGPAGSVQTVPSKAISVGDPASSSKRAGNLPGKKQNDDV